LCVFRFQLSCPLFFFARAMDGGGGTVNHDDEQRGADTSSSSELSYTTTPTAPTTTASSTMLPSSSWQQTLSASFNHLSEQFQSTSKAIASVPAFPDQTFAAIMARLDDIEKAQQQLQEEINALKTQMANVPKTEPQTDAIDKALASHVEEFKLEQARLAPRLYNASVVKNAVPIKPLPLKNGKSPPNFPGTKGEFEHLTRERYQDLLAAYGLPTDGDKEMRRERLRAFLGMAGA